MRKQGFLNKLFREGKIRIVEPSAQVQEAYRKKSESYLTSAKILLENERLEETVSMAYYREYLLACTTRSIRIIQALCRPLFWINSCPVGTIGYDI